MSVPSKLGPVELAVVGVAAILSVTSLSPGTLAANRLRLQDVEQVAFGQLDARYLIHAEHVHQTSIVISNFHIYSGQSPPLKGLGLGRLVGHIDRCINVYALAQVVSQ